MGLLQDLVRSCASMLGFAPPHSAFFHLLGHVLPGSLFVCFGLVNFWRAPRSDLHPAQPFLTKPWVSTCGALAIGLYASHQFFNGEERAHVLHHFTWFGAFGLALATSALRRVLYPGTEHAMYALAFISEAVLLFAHDAAPLETQGHHFVAWCALLAAACMAWHFGTGAPLARRCALYMTTLHGAVYVEIGLYLGSAFRGWGLPDVEGHALHRAIMYQVVFIMWSAFAIFGIFIGRLSSIAKRDQGFEKTPCDDLDVPTLYGASEVSGGA